jgi:hypothetical protein
MSAVPGETRPDPVPRIPLNARLRRRQGRYFAIGYQHTVELSDTAVFIWNQVDGTAGLPQIARAVSDEYGIDDETALADTSELLGELAGHQLVVWDTPPA